MSKCWHRIKIYFLKWDSADITQESQNSETALDNFLSQKENIGNVPVSL